MQTKLYSKKLFQSVLVALVFFVLPVAMLAVTPAKKAAADDMSGNHFIMEGKWIDRAHLEITKFEFTDDEFLDDDQKQFIPGNTDDEKLKNLNDLFKSQVVGTYAVDNVSPDLGSKYDFIRENRLGAPCNDTSQTQIDVDDGSKAHPSQIKGDKVSIRSGNLYVRIESNSGGTRCIQPLAPAGISSPRLISANLQQSENRNIWFKQKAGVDGIFERVDHKEGDFKRTEDPKLYKSREVEGPCVIRIDFRDIPKQGNNTVNFEHCTNGIEQIKDVVAVVTDATKINKPASTTDSSGNPTSTECETQLLNPLTWLMCPLIEAGVLAATTLDNAITQQLTVQTGPGSIYDESSADPNSPGRALFNVWASFRYIALGILVIIGLVMIISQAMSFGIFDAYTIKKILPKILVGVIGISVSWYLCKFAIDFFNDLGIAVRSLLYGPFKDLPGVKFDAGAVSLLGVGTGVLVLGLGIVGILSFVATALMAIIIAFGVLVFRQILIILLVVTAPLAIVCWILPNTEKVWKMWWDFFTRALVVFPIIALFIAGGRVIAQIATLNSVQDQQSNFLASTIAFIAYFGPYFALPAAFRLAGGAIATIGGLANDRSRGAFDRLKGFRQKRAKERVEAFRNAGLYDKSTLRGRIGNKLGGLAFDADEQVPYYLGKGGGKYNPFGKRSQQIGAKIEHAKQEQSVEMFKKWHGSGAANDKFFAAVMGSMSDLGEAKDIHGRKIRDRFEETRGSKLDLTQGLDTAEKIDAAAKILSESTDTTHNTAAVGLHRNKSSIVNRVRDGNGYADIHAASMLGLSVHGFGSEESMVEAANKIAAKAPGDESQRAFAEGMLVFSEVNGTSARKAGYGHGVDPKKRTFTTGTRAGRDWAGVASKSASDIARLKRGQAVGDAQKLIDIVRYAESNPVQRQALEEKMMAEEGLSKEAVAQRVAGAEEKAKRAKVTLASLGHSYTGGATDTIGAISSLLEDPENQKILGGNIDPNARGTDDDTPDDVKAAQAPKGPGFGSETPPPPPGREGIF